MSAETKEDTVLECAKACEEAASTYYNLPSDTSKDERIKFRQQRRELWKKFGQRLDKEMPDSDEQAVTLLKALNALPRHKDSCDYTELVISACIETKKYRALDGILRAYPGKYKHALAAAATFGNPDTVREILEYKGVRWDYMALMDADEPEINKEISALLRSWIPKCNGVYYYPQGAGLITEKDMQYRLEREALEHDWQKKTAKYASSEMHRVQAWLDGKA